MGDLVRPGDNLIELFDTNVLEVRAQIPTKYVVQVSFALKNKEKIMATMTANGETFEFVCDRVAAEVKQGTAGLDAFFRVLSGNDLIPMGATLQLTVHMPAQADLIAVPSNAIYGLNKVYLVVDGRLQAVSVDKVGNYTKSGQQWALIKSADIKAGDQIVVNQLPNAITGLKVKIMNKLSK